MIYADRYGKLGLVAGGTAVERHEDLLTSYVFGLLRYLPWECGMGLLLERSGISEPARIDVGVPNVVFWPIEGNTEPDVLLDGPRLVTLVEAKLGSDFGVTQLGREWCFLVARAGDRRKLLLTVTRQRYTATEIRERVTRDLAELVATVPHPTLDEVRAIRWHDIGRWILLDTPPPEAPHMRAVLDDLEWVLGRAGLLSAPFNGWPPQVTRSFGDAAWYAWRYFGHIECRADNRTLWGGCRGEGYFAMSSQNPSPHETFNAGYRFLLDYLRQVDRLLRAVINLLEEAQPSWRRLRQDGDKYMSDLAPMAGTVASWLPGNLFVFFALSEAFSTVYGVPASKVGRVAFVGACLGPPEEGKDPELRLGWFEGLDHLNGSIEGHLRDLYDASNPHEYEVWPPLATDLNAIEWPELRPRPAKTSGQTRRLTIRCVPFSVLGDETDLRRLMSSFIRALNGSSGLPPRADVVKP